MRKIMLGLTAATLLAGSAFALSPRAASNAPAACTAACDPSGCTTTSCPGPGNCPCGCNR
ncbi:MAG: hypothetical protein U0167_14335 [bacterium]